jgi:hypothetical protein
VQASGSPELLACSHSKIEPVKPQYQLQFWRSETGAFAVGEGREIKFWSSMGELALILDAGQARGEFSAGSSRATGTPNADSRGPVFSTRPSPMWDRSLPSASGADVGVRHGDMVQSSGVGELVFQWSVVSLEQRDEERQCEEGMRAHFE